MINIERVKNILLNPTTEWPRIEQERNSIQEIFHNYLAWLVGLAAIGTFVSMAIIGAGGFGLTMRFGVGDSLLQAILTALFTLLMVCLLAWIVNAIAPNFGATRSALNAFKLVAYASTAGLVGGFIAILPFLGVVGLLGGLYSIYLIYKGLPVLMNNPPERSLVYTLAVLACGIVLALLFGFLSSVLLPESTSADLAGSEISIETQQGTIDVGGTAPDRFSKRLEAMNENMSEAKKSDNPAEIAKAAAEGLSALLSGKEGARKPTSKQALKAYIPETLNGMSRISFEANSGKALGLSLVSVQAEYKSADQSLLLDISDLGMGAAFIELAGWAGSEFEKETDASIEQTFKDGNRLISENSHKDGSEAEYRLMLANGIVVEARARYMSLDQLKQTVLSLDMHSLEAIN